MPPRGAVVAAGGGAGGPNQAGQQQQQGAGGLLQMIMRLGMMWYFFNSMKGMGGGQQAGAGGAAGGKGGVAPSTLRPLHARGSLFDVRFLLSDLPEMATLADGKLIWQRNDVGLGTTAEHKFTYVYHPTEAVKTQNASVWLHAVFSVAGADPDAREDLPPGSVFTKTMPLIRHMAPRKNRTGVNLLSAEGGAPYTAPKRKAPAPSPSPDGGAASDAADPPPPLWAPHWKPNATLSVIDHFNSYGRGQVPPQMRDLFVTADEGGERYLPLAYFDEFWLLRDKLVALNGSVTELPLHLCVKTASIWWMQLQQQMEQSFAMQVGIGVANEGESDEVKRIFLEGNPVLLAVTMLVSLLHSVFDFLAFKNDVAFWKDNKSMEGLSARSVLVNAFCQLVILLYLFDNETSTVVLISSAVGTAIEFWKVTRAFDVSLDLGKFPYVSIKDKASYKDSRHNTDRHDAEAMRYLSYALYPLVIGYSAYTLKYETHRSWWSWVVSSLVGAVYTFGFILMCPQLYLNYKLKSVAHLPWRQMTYKFLNTIVDDLFAFVIKMPLLHRLAVFRDDVIFCVFLYQRWIYRVDKTRVNEFGFSGEMEEEAARRRAAAAAAAGGGGEAPALVEGAGAAAATAVVEEVEEEPAAAAAGSEAEAAGGARRRKAPQRGEAEEVEEEEQEQEDDKDK